MIYLKAQFCVIYSKTMEAKNLLNCFDKYLHKIWRKIFFCRKLWMKILWDTFKRENLWISHLIYYFFHKYWRVFSALFQIFRQIVFFYCKIESENFPFYLLFLCHRCFSSRNIFGNTKNINFKIKQMKSFRYR